MSGDDVFDGNHGGASDFSFNSEVAAVFDDMLARSVPFYTEQQSLVREIAARFWIPESTIVDIGCSLATTLIGIARALPDAAQLVGFDNSQPMLNKAQARVESAGLASRIDLRHADINQQADRLDFGSASVVTVCWTLQFIRPLQRDALIKKIYDSLLPGGVLIVTEKVLTNDSNMNRFFIDFYYDFKRANGYSNEEIMTKREALENVLIPYRIDENMDLFRRNGFSIVETFFQWYNFAGFLCVKRG